MSHSLANGESANDGDDGGIKVKSSDVNDDQDAGADVVTHYPTGISVEVVHANMTSMRTPPRTAWANNSNTSNNKIELRWSQMQQDELNFLETKEENETRSIDYNNLGRYIKEHQRFLKLIDKTRHLTLNERRQLDIQKAELKRLQDRLTKKIEENNFQHQYKQQKQTIAWRRREIFLRRRAEEAALKETRKPLVQTTFFLPKIERLSRTSVIRSTRTDRSIESFLLPMINASNSSPPMSRSGILPVPRSQVNSVECQTENINDSEKQLTIENKQNVIIKNSKHQTDEMGQQLYDSITQFVERSKRWWTK